MYDASSPSPTPSRLSSATVGGLIAGTVDIGAASLINWVSPTVVCQAISSGILGRNSFKEGWASALLGVALQWAMSVVIALIYGGAVDLFPRLRQRWVLGGLIAGVVTFFVMNYVVLRLSAVGRYAHFTLAGFLENLAAILVYGLIIAYCARPLSQTQKAPGSSPLA